MKAIVLCLLIGFCLTANTEGQAMMITSPEFNENEMMPKKFTCQGEDINPRLIISDIPEGTKSLALIVDDPDAPMGTWVHWVVFNIPADTTEIDENTIPGVQGWNDFGKENYGGPCPPSGTHRYFHKIYALDEELFIKKGSPKKHVIKAMAGHILDQAQIIGLYKKK